MNLLHFDRWAAVWFAGPLKRAFRTDRQPRVSVLMYHGISPAAPTSRIPYYDTVTDPKTFRAQMRFLREQGCRVIGLEAAAQEIASGQLTGNKTVVITFDDGFRDFYENAVPALEENGFTATMFLPTSFIGEPRRKFKETECMTWREISELAARGFEFGGHSVTHRKLATLSPRELEEELRDCKADIEQRIQKPITTFACPFAFPQANQEFVARYRAALEKFGYKTAVTTCIGRATVGDDLLTLKRLPMNRFDDSKLLYSKLTGGYDWLDMVQSSVQTIKTLRAKRNQHGNRVSSVAPVNAL